MSRLNFAENLNAHGSVKGLENFLKRNLTQIYSYPDYRYTNFLDSISKVFQISADSIAVGAGTTEILFTLPRFLQGKVLIIAPTFWEYSLSNIRAKNKIDYHILREENDFEIDFNDLQKRIKKVDVVYLCNPNNPTSTIISKDKLISIVRENSGTSFVVDETYMVFRHDYDDLTIVREAEKVQNLYVVTSFSKIFSIPGLRAGFVASNAGNIKKLKNFLPPYSSNVLSVLATIYSLKDNEFLRKTRIFYKIQRTKAFKVFSDGLNKKLKIFYPEANFILAKILVEKNSTVLTAELEERGIFIRDCSEFLGLGNKWIRFAIRKDRDNGILLANLKKFL